LAVVLLGSAGCWLGLLILVPPVRQEFPLADDWAFAKGAFLFAQGQGCHYFRWAAMPQLGQWLWAVPFIEVMGPRHLALRLSTIVLAWIGLWGFYDLLRQEGWGTRLSAFATALLAFNPIFFLLQGTFMTDVPALALSLAALALYSRAFAGRRPAHLVAGAAVAVVAAVTRQTAWAVPVAAAVMLWRSPPLRWRPAWVAGVAAPAVAALWAHAWFQLRPDITPARPMVPSMAQVVVTAFLFFHLGGLAAAPLLCLKPRPRSWLLFAAGSAIMGASAWYLHEKGGYVNCARWFPYRDGLVTLCGPYSAVLTPGQRPVLLTEPVRIVLTLVGCAAGGLLLARTVDEFRRQPRGGPLLVFTLAQLPFLLVAPYVFDRYFLVLFPGALYLAANHDDESPWGWFAGLGLLAVLAGLSVVFMHDWLAWNSARWAVAMRAVEHGTDPREIEGGFEWNGWWFAQSGDADTGPGGSRSRFVVAFSELPGMRTVDAEPYTQWLPPGRRQFLLLQTPVP
jgi:hypothetical protein